jgi:hypothetical protein
MAEIHFSERHGARENLRQMERTSARDSYTVRDYFDDAM